MDPIVARRRIRSAFGRLADLSLILLLGLGLSRAQPAQAGGAVTDCTETGLLNALDSPGLVTFNCGGTHAPATIILTSSIIVPTHYSLDGHNGGQTVVLDGQVAGRLFIVQAGAQLALANITLDHGGAGNGGCLYGDGDLTLDHVELRNCQARSGKIGGALYVSSVGHALISFSNLHDNSAGDAGGAIYSEGTLAISDTQLAYNSATTSGGAIYNLGTLTMTNSTLAHNTAQVNDGGGLWNAGSAWVDGGTVFSNTAPGGWGGGLYDQGALVVTDSTLNANLAGQGGGGLRNYLGSVNIVSVTVSGNSANWGGGLHNSGYTVLTNATLSDNHATNSGGGLYDDGPANADISDSTIVGNSAASFYGGGIYNHFNSDLSVTRSALRDNSAKAGGGLYNDAASTASFDHVLFSDNSAVNSGGGLYNEDFGGLVSIFFSTLSGNTATEGGGLANFGKNFNVDSSTLVGNVASLHGGGLYNSGLSKVHLTNTTISGNTAGLGGGLYNVNGSVVLWNATFSQNSASHGGALWLDGAATTVLTNTILAYSPAGGNCLGSVTASSDSLSSDPTCALPGTVHGLSVNNLDPLLTALGAYGGPTRVHMLKHNSPAIDGVGGNNAPGQDQRAFPRPQGGYDIGAVERQPGDSDLAPWLFLPLVRR